jgi:hypothetical protein
MTVQNVVDKVFKFFCVYGTHKLRLRAFKWLQSKLDAGLYLKTVGRVGMKGWREGREVERVGG